MRLDLVAMLIMRHQLVAYDINLLITVLIESVKGLINYGINFKKVQVLRTYNQEEKSLEELDEVLVSKIIVFVRFFMTAIYSVFSAIYVNNINYTYISAVLVANAWLHESECSRMRRLSAEGDNLYSVSTFLEVFNSFIRLIHTSTLIYFIIINSF